MDLVILVLGLALVGFLTWLITEKVPMDDIFKVGIRVIVLVVVLLYLIKTFGHHIPNLLT